MKNGIVCFAIKRYTVTINGISVSPSWFLAVQRTVNWREINGIPLFGTFEKRYRIFAKKRYNVIVSVSPSWFCCTFNMPSIAHFFVQCTVNWQNIPIYRCLEFLKTVWSFGYKHPR